MLDKMIWKFGILEKVIVIIGKFCRNNILATLNRKMYEGCLKSKLSKIRIKEHGYKMK